MTTSLWNSWRKAKARRATRTQASGSSPLTWKIGAWTILATSVGYTDERAESGGVVKPSWLLMTRWTVPPGPVALERRQVERLGHHALAGEGGVAVDQDAAAPGSARPARCRSCLARAMPSTTGSTASRCEGLDGQLDRRWCCPMRLTNLPSGPLWYFTSPEPWVDVGVDVALELLEQLP